MRLPPFTGLLAVLLAPLAAQAESDPALLRFLHPDAKALISIDWKRLRQSHLGTMIREKWVDSNPAGAIPGAEFLDDVDLVLVSSPGRNSADPSAEAPVLIALRGRFDLEKVRAVLASHAVKPQMFNNTQVYRPQGKGGKDMAFVLLDPQTILIGDARSVFASLERNTFPAPDPGAGSLLSRAAQLDAGYDAWALITTPGVLASDRLMDMFTGGELNAQARGVEIGFSLRNGLSIDTSVLFQSESAAKRMASELSRMLRLAIKDKMGEPAMLDLEKKLKIGPEGTLVKIAVHMTQQELDKNARIFAASHPAAPIAASERAVASVHPSVKASPAPSAPPQEKKVIRIEGLDEGPREIPFKQQ